jgi:hypothetical protein
LWIASGCDGGEFVRLSQGGGTGGAWGGTFVLMWMVVEEIMNIDRFVVM